MYLPLNLVLLLFLVVLYYTSTSQFDRCGHDGESGQPHGKDYPGAAFFTIVATVVRLAVVQGGLSLLKRLTLLKVLY